MHNDTAFEKPGSNIFIVSRVIHTYLPDVHKQQEYEILRQQMSDKLYELIMRHRNPVLVEIIEYDPENLSSIGANNLEEIKIGVIITNIDQKLLGDKWEVHEVSIQTEVTFWGKVLEWIRSLLFSKKDQELLKKYEQGIVEYRKEVRALRDALNFAINAHMEEKENTVYLKEKEEDDKNTSITS